MKIPYDERDIVRISVVDHPESIAMRQLSDYRNDDGLPPNGKPGPIYRQLLAAWSEEVGVDIAGQARQYAELAGTWTP